jgi:putative membrane protein insertion efficiency factor
MSRFFAIVMIAFIRVYRLTRPFRPSICRFSPTCSTYAWQAIVVYGPWRGGWKALARLFRCHPYSAGGMDYL